MHKSMLIAAALFAGVAACTPPAPPAPDAPAPGPAGTQAPKVREGYTAADVAFLQGMIGHHAQALEMTAFIPDRSTRRDFHLMKERIEISQRDEIAFMKRWLEKHGESLPDDDAHVHAAMGHGELMPGMLTDAELAAMREAKDVAFERLFLQGMIKHHEGAIRMVETLFRSGGGVHPEIYIFATDVNADQSAEIRRMRSMLASLGG